MSEEPDMINTTLDNRRNLRELIIYVSLFLAFQAFRKNLKYVKFRSTTNQNCFMLVPVSGMVIMASVELSGELMQEIHQI